MGQEENIDLIERYLDQKLNEKERADFEARLASDADFASDFEKHETTHKLLDFMISENLRSQLKSLESEDTKVVPMISRSRRLSFVAIAATVAILVGAFFFLRPGNMSSQQLAMEYYETPAFNMRGVDDAMPSGLSEGLKALQSGNFAEAITILESVDASDNYYTTSRYYLGHAYYGAGNYANAMTSFEMAANGGDIRLREDAEWYGLLSCLGANGLCDKRLQSIVENQTHAYQAKALQIQSSK